MKTADEREAVLSAILAWDLPKLRAAKDPAANEFVELMQLRLRSPDNEDGSPTRLSPLMHANRGLRAELGGDQDRARAHYTRCSTRPGLAGMLGRLLLAWMQDAPQQAFRRPSQYAERHTSVFGAEVVARVEGRLMVWALDRGWRELAAQHYAAALKAASDEYKRILSTLGDWFGETQVFTFGGNAYSDLIAYPWIVGESSRAAERYVEDQVRELARSPWARTITLGAGSGTAVEAAEMQASWVGALWLLPQLRRQIAGHLLVRQQGDEEVSRGLGMWIVGQGADARQLVDASESRLTADSVRELLEGHLASGAKVRNPETWTNVCTALWDELPESLALNLVAATPIPQPGAVSRYSTAAGAFGLFALLALRVPDAWAARFDTLPLESAALTVAAMSPAVAMRLPAVAAARGLAAFLRASDSLTSGDWAGAGWSTAAALLQAGRAHLSDPDAYVRELTQAIPDSALVDVLLVEPSLVSSQRYLELVDDLTLAVLREASDAESGRYSGWARNPVMSLAAAMSARQDPREQALRAIDALAVHPLATHDQRVAAFTALRQCFDELAVDAAHFRVTSMERVVTRAGFMRASPADNRLEAAAHLALRARAEVGAVPVGAVVAGCRDADVRVRRQSVETASWLTERRPFGALDAALFGALYDPHPRVQTAAVEALCKGNVADAALGQAGGDRLLDLLATAHREVRASIVAGIRDTEAWYLEDLRPRVQAIAASDRSWVVRDAAQP